jgi:hypothetical protein
MNYHSKNEVTSCSWTFGILTILKIRLPNPKENLCNSQFIQSTSQFKSIIKYDALDNLP